MFKSSKKKFLLYYYALEIQLEETTQAVAFHLCFLSCLLST